MIISKWLITYGVLAVFLLADWRALRASNRPTRWTAILLLAVCGVLWALLWNDVELPRLTVWIQLALSPLNFIH